MKRLPVWFERTENLAIAIAVVVAFVRLHFSWWWLPAFFLAFDASMAGYLVNERAGAVCYNLAHAYIAPAVLLLSYVLSTTRWCAFVGLLWAFHIAADRVLGYGLKSASSFQDTHLGRIGKQRLPGPRHPLLNEPGDDGAAAGEREDIVDLKPEPVRSLVAHVPILPDRQWQAFDKSEHRSG